MDLLQYCCRRAKSFDDLASMVYMEFKLDLKDSIHLTIWENWIMFLTNLDLLIINDNWAYPKDINYTIDDHDALITILKGDN